MRFLDLFAEPKTEGFENCNDSFSSTFELNHLILQNLVTSFDSNDSIEIDYPVAAHETLINSPPMSEGTQVHLMKMLNHKLMYFFVPLFVRINSYRSANEQNYRPSFMF